MDWTWETALEEGETISEELKGTWRWGTCWLRVFNFEGKTYAVKYNLAVEEGLEDSYPCNVYEVRPVEKTITEWVAI